jgi:hypothetical protein
VQCSARVNGCECCLTFARMDSTSAWPAGSPTLKLELPRLQLEPLPEPSPSHLRVDTWRSADVDPHPAAAARAAPPAAYLEHYTAMPNVSSTIRLMQSPHTGSRSVSNAFFEAALGEESR